MEKKKFEWTDALVILMFLGGGVWLVYSSFNVDKKDGVRRLITLTEKGIETRARLEDSVRVEELQGSTDTTRRYFNTYHFIVQGKTYSGEVETSTMPEAKFVRIKYLPEDPGIHSYDPERDLSEARSDAKYGWKFWLGLFLCLCGGASLWELISPKKEAPKERVEL